MVGCKSVCICMGIRSQKKAEEDKFPSQEDYVTLKELMRHKSSKKECKTVAASSYSSFTFCSVCKLNQFSIYLNLGRTIESSQKNVYMSYIHMASLEVIFLNLRVG